MRYVILLAYVLLLAIPGVVSAQDDQYPECSLLPTRDILIEQLNAVASWSDLEAFSGDVGSSLAFCQGLMFEGNGDRVIGPVGIPPGFYTLRIMGDGSLEGELISGDCDSLFAYIERGQSSTEEGFRSDGCTLLLTVDSSTSWSFEFALVESIDVPTPEDAVAMLQAYFDGDVNRGNSYVCAFAWSSEEEIANLQGITLESVDCHYEDFEMVCDLTLESDGVQTESTQRITISDGKFCGFE